MFKNENRHYSLRKLSVGLASILIGISFASNMNGNSVKADTVKIGSNGAQTIKVNDAVAKDSNTAAQGSDAVVKIDAKFAPEWQNQTPEAAKKDSGAITQDIRQKAVKAPEAVAKLQNNEVKNNSDAKNAADDSKAAVKDAAESASKGVNSAAKQPNTAVQGSDAVGDKASKANNSSAVQEDSSAKNDSSTAKNNALKATVEAAKQDLETPVVPHADGNEAALLTTTGKKFNAQMLSASKVISPTNDTNGGFDSSWGTLDVTDWKGFDNGDYYVLTHYVTDNSDDAHIVVPNEADFEKAGISTGGKQVAVTKYFFKNIQIYSNTSARSIRSLAFSKTAGKQVKAIGNNWTDAFSNYGFSKFNGENLDVSEVTSMHDMFENCSNLSDIRSLAHWDTSNVTNMDGMFRNCNNLSNISSLANWDTSKVTYMGNMFENCGNLSDISSLANWDTSKVINMSYMFGNCNNLSNISSLANWDTSKVTGMSYMFNGCKSLSDISPLANWDTSKVTSMVRMFNGCESLSDISPLAHWDTSKVNNMYSMFANTPLKKVTLTKWDFSNINPYYGFKSIFPDTNFEATLSDKTSKSLLNISSKLLDSAKEKLKRIDSAPIVDGVPDVDGRIQQYLDQINLGKEEYQQQLDNYKQQIDHYKKELADPNADTATKENNKDELKQVEQEYQYYLTGDGKKEYDGQIQDFQGEFEQYKQDLQQEINRVKLHAEYPLNSAFGNHSKITTPNQDLLVYLVGKLPVKSDATRTIEITFPDGTKKTINQSIGYGKYAISGTADMATHKLDMAMPYELSKWEPIKKEDGSYDLVKAHVNKNGVAIFDAVQLPKIPGYTAFVKTVANPVNPARARFTVSFMALPKLVTHMQNDVKPTETVTPATPEVAKPIKTEPKVTISATPKAIDLSDDVVATAPDVSTWQVANEPSKDTYRVSNGKYAVELPHIRNAQLHVIVNNSTKDSILFTYKRQHTKYVFKIKFVNGHYLLTTYKIKSGKLVKLIDYNFVKSSKMIDIILDWLTISNPFNLTYIKRRLEKYS